MKDLLLPVHQLPLSPIGDKGLEADAYGVRRPPYRNDAGEYTPASGTDDEQA